MTLTVTQRVQTPLGPGTILGFEIFVDNGHRSDITETDYDTNRVLVRLDNPGMWLGANEKQPHPFMYRSQLSELHE